jgi:hypothetical protein
MRAAVRAMCAHIAFGGPPTEERMRPILQAEGLEEAKLQGVRPRRHKEDHEYVTNPINVSSDTTDTFSLSRLLAEYAECKSFVKLAERHGIHRPEIRRVFRNAAKQLLESRLQDRQALGAWIHMLIEKANPHGPGVTKRQAAKEGDIHRLDPPELALFRIMICKDNADILDDIFAPHGNQ